MTGSAAAAAARCKNLRRGSFIAFPLKSSDATLSFRLDARRLDEWPPFLGLGLVERVKRFRILLLPPEYLLADVGEPLAYRRVGEASTTAELSFTTISLGVPLGTH